MLRVYFKSRNFISLFNASFNQFIEYQDVLANLLNESTVTLNFLCNFLLMDRVVYRLICSPRVLLQVCIFVLLVDFQVRFDGNILVPITPVPAYCYFVFTVRPFLQFRMFTH